VDGAENGTRTYAINAADASNGVITITAIFNHTDLVPDPIEFTEPGHITKTYGDAAFINAVVTGYSGSGAITYSSSNTTVATVTSSGQVTILKVGSTIITAEKAADETYAYARAEYTLAVNPKAVTITGLSAANKQYDGTTTATVTGTATISGKISTDTVTVNAGTAAFVDATVGNNKTVTFSGYSLTDADAGNYTLLAQPTSVTANIEGMIDMVPIPAGTFMMGQTSITDATPEHSVTLSGFYMGKYQVTQEQYQAVMGSNPSSFNSSPQAGETQGKRPVERVSWYDALVFCNKLSTMEGLTPAYSISGSTDPAVWGSVPASTNATWNTVVIVAGSNGYRLPTEAEWEYACRAGTTTAYNTGETISDNTGWYDGNSGNKTHEVGLKPANAWGLYDMHGNVYEWCWDWYGTYASGAQTNPTGASSGSNRVIRGGSWVVIGRYLRSAIRIIGDPSVRVYDLGFRLVRQ